MEDGDRTRGSGRIKETEASSCCFGSTRSGADACGEMRRQVGRRDRVGAAAAVTGSRRGVRGEVGVEIFFYFFNV